MAIIGFDVANFEFWRDALDNIYLYVIILHYEFGILNARGHRCEGGNG